MLADFILESANNPGTGLSISLAGAQTGRLRFRDRFSDGSPAFYFVDDGNQAEWGKGTVRVGTPDTIERTTVIGNTARTTARLNFTGAIDVYCEVPAEVMLFADPGTGLIKPAPGLVASIDPNMGGVPIGGGMDYWGSVAPTGWLFAYGQAVSRTTYAALFGKLSTTYGTGDGASTFNLPDKRGYVSYGKDDMGGTNANRITPVITNALGAQGGSCYMQNHGHNVTYTDPGHAHTTRDTGHAHTVYDPTHAHSVYDPTHAHPEYGYVYSYSSGDRGSIFLSQEPATTGAVYLGGTGGAYTGIAIYGAYTGVLVNSGVTGVAVLAGSTGITITATNAGTGAAQNLPPGIVCNYIIYAGPTS